MMTTDPFVAAYGETPEGAKKRVVEAFGKQYALKSKIPGMILLDFMEVAAGGMGAEDPGAGKAMKDFLRSVFTKESWTEFHEDSIEEGADLEELFEVLKQAMVVINGFPTTQPSASAVGPSSITPSSTEPSYEERKRALGLVPVTPESLAELAG